MNGAHTSGLVATAILTGALASQQSPDTAKAKPGPGRVEGVVVDSFGRPMPNAEVWVINADISHARTDSVGRFAFGRLPLGFVNVRAKVRGWHRGGGQAQITDDGALQFARVVVLPASDIRVRVVDEQGAPVAGAEVSHSRTSSPGSYFPERSERAVTDANGVVQIEDVALGDTMIYAWAPGFGLGSGRWYVGDDGDVVVLLPKAVAFSLHLTLAGATAEQRRDAQWSLYSMRDGYGAGCGLPPALLRGRFGEDGTTLVSGLPGDMELTNIGVGLADAVVVPSRVTVKPGELKAARHDLRFEVAPLAGLDVCGAVVGPDGKPVPGMTITCRSFPGSTTRDQQTRTDATGAFVFSRVAEAGGQFRLSSLDRRFVFDQAKEDAFNTLRYRRQFEGKVEPDRRWEVACVLATEIRGRVVDGKDQGVAGASVRLMAQWPGQSRSISVSWAATDRDGLFVLPRQNGTDGTEVWIEVTSPDGDGQGAPFRLAAGQVVALPNVVVAAPGVVEGIVVDAGGAPVAGASLKVLRPEGHESASTISDREGRFRIVAGPGTVRLLCGCGHERDLGKQAQSIELKSGEALQMRLQRARQ